MYDFFIDRIITLSSIERGNILKKTQYGGGSIRNIPTKEIAGGNAINIAYCLAKLEQQVVLFTVADEFGSTLLKSLFRDIDGIELRIVKGKPGFTTSLEFRNKDGKIESNVMISDVGDNRFFGPEKFTNEDLDILRKSAAVIIVNWATNIKGTELAKFVYNNSPKSIHFLDPADINERISEFCNDFTTLSNRIDTLSMNENECNAILSKIGERENLLCGKYLSRNIKYASKIIAKKFKTNIIIHTKEGAAWSDGFRTDFISSEKDIDIEILTGAGDSWDAAYVLGDMISLTKRECLLFANIFASIYISTQNREKITLPSVVEKYVKSMNKNENKGKRDFTLNK